MLDPELRRKLSRVNRERPSVEPAPQPASEPHVVTLEEILPGRVHTHQHGDLYVCETKLDVLLPKDAESIMSSVAEVGKLVAKAVALLASPSPPDLVLNRHCGECEFQGR